MRVEALGPMRTASMPSIRGGREARIGGLGTPSRSDRALGSRRLDGTARLPRRTGNPRPRRTLPMRLSRNGMRGTVGPRAGRWSTTDAVGRGLPVEAPANRVRSQPHQNRWPPCAKLVWPPCAKLESPCVKPEWPCTKLEWPPLEGGDPDLKLRGALPPGWLPPVGDRPPIGYRLLAEGRPAWRDDPADATRGEDAVGRVTATSPSSGRRRLPSHSRR